MGVGVSGSGEQGREMGRWLECDVGNAGVGRWEEHTRAQQDFARV